MQYTGSIVVLDHDPTIVELLVEILTDEGYIAYSARDDAGALAAIVRHPSALLMLDVLMPGMHGALIAQVRAVGPATMPIVVMTTSPHDAEPLLVPGSIECLAKPLTSTICSLASPTMSSRPRQWMNYWRSARADRHRRTRMMKRDLPRGDPPLRTIRHEFSLRSLLSVIAIAAGFWLLVQIWQIILLLVIALILAGTLSH
jgi:CheY-like chemotaxis protein